MFLKQNNTIKWKFLIIASAVAAVLCFAVIYWFDKSVFLFLRKFDSSVWLFFDLIFATKIWLSVSAVFCGVFSVKNILLSKGNLNKSTKQFNVKEKIKEFIVKSKTNIWFMIFCSVFVSAVITGVLKFVIGRARPVFFEALSQTGFLPFSKDWAFNSMPSGHTSASFAGLVMIGLLFPKFKWLTWSTAIVIGVSRIAIGAHFPSDVIFGAFIGMVVADFVKYTFSKKIK